MAKSNTEATKEKPPKNKLKKVPALKEEKPYERPLIDPPEDEEIKDNFDDPVFIEPAEDIELGKDDHDPGPLPNKEKDFGPADQLRAAGQLKPKIEITKGKLLKGDIVQVEYTKRDSPDSKPAECSEKHADPPRKEFKNAFAGLAVHSAMIGEFIPIVSIDINDPDPEQIKDFTVTGFTIHEPGEEDEGVILTAHKTLKSGKALGFNTPLIRINDASENAYPYLDELSESIDLCKKEIALYLSGKHAPDPQLSLGL